MSDAPVAPEFELRNAGPGPDPCSLAALAREHEFAVLLFQRDHLCTNCRKQVQRVTARYDDFRARRTVAVSVLPEPLDRAADWQDTYDLPYPMLADPETTVSAAYDQPVRLGFIGDWSDFLGRQPRVVVVDLRPEDPRIVWSHSGRSTFDRPPIDDVLAAVDDHRE